MSVVETQTADTIYVDSGANSQLHDEEWCHVKEPEAPADIETSLSTSLHFSPTDSPKSLCEALGYASEEQSVPEFVVEQRRLGKEIEKLEKENLCQAARLGELQRLDDSRQKQLRDQSAVMSELQKELQSTRISFGEQVSELEGSVRVAQQESADKDQQIVQLQRQLNTAQQQYSDAQQQVQEWRQKTQHLQHVHNSVLLAQKEQTEQLMAATQQIAEMTLHHQQLHASTTRERQSEHAAWEETMQGLRRRVASLEAHKHETSTELEQQLQRMSQAVVQLQTENEQLRAQLMGQQQQYEIAYGELRNEVELYKYLLREETEHKV